MCCPRVVTGNATDVTAAIAIAAAAAAAASATAGTSAVATATPAAAAAATVVCVRATEAAVSFRSAATDFPTEAEVATGTLDNPVYLTYRVPRSPW